MKKVKHTGTQAELKIVNKSTPFAIREAFKALYTNILYLNIEDKCKKIAITSAVPGEAKTTISLNLAITLAQTLEDKKVLLIDADLRQPKIAKLLSIDPKSKGLSEYLAGIDESPNIINTPEYKLSVLVSGASGANPTKLIGSTKMAELLKKCEEEYDYVIIDTPPVNVVSDAVLLSNVINGYVISTKADHSNVNNVNECLETLERVGAEVFGVVLSSVKLKTSGKRYGKYSKYNLYAN